MQTVREVVREFERRRTAAAALREKRQIEIYGKSPRIKEIDGRLVALGMEISRAVLYGGDAPALIQKLSEENMSLTAEKRGILEGLNIPERYLEDVYTCNTCKDTGYTDNSRCACFRNKLIEEYYKFSGLGKVLKKENFANFREDLFSGEKDEKTGISPKNAAIRNLNIARNFVENFYAQPENLFMFGSTGLGKTFLCNCIAKALLDKGFAVIYLTAPQLFKMVENARFNRDEDTPEKEGFLDMLPVVDLLIIDDLGTEVSTMVTASELFSILNTRLLNGRSTVISTNFSIDEITDIYSDRITSRIFGNYTLLSFAGDDLRVKLRYKV